MAPIEKLGPKLVKVRIPEHYGTFHSSRGEGVADVQYRGGDVAEVTEREAKIYGLEVLQAPAPKAPETPKP